MNIVIIRDSDSAIRLIMLLHIFLTSDLRSLLEKKYIVFMGDSNIRAIYKDILCLLKADQMIPEQTLRTKREDSVFGDTLLTHGPKTNGRDYKEERYIDCHQVKLEMFFLTQIYNEYVVDVLGRITSGRRKPDVLVLNSCLWDITRWGPAGVSHYKENMATLLRHLQHVLPDCLVIWVTTPPISKNIKGGFLLNDLNFMEKMMRFHVMEANSFARQEVVRHGFDVLDSHYHLKMQIHRRAGDGVHWLPPAVRYVTNLLLTHICVAFNAPLPGRCESIEQENLETSEEKPPIEVQKHLVHRKYVKAVMGEERIRRIEKASGARVQFKRNRTDSSKSTPRKDNHCFKSFHISGSKDQVEKAHDMIAKAVRRVREKNIFGEFGKVISEKPRKKKRPRSHDPDLRESPPERHPRKKSRSSSNRIRIITDPSQPHKRRRVHINENDR